MNDKMRKKLEKLFIKSMNEGGDPDAFERYVKALVEKEKRLG